MYEHSVKYYDALYHFHDYGSACARLYELITQYNPRASSLLDVACGTGRHLEHLQHRFHVQGLDLNANMLDIARRRCPGVELHCASMVDFHLGSTFDVVTCLFSSIAYVKTVSNLERAVHAMANHLREGGTLFVEPWFTPETFWVGRLTANLVDEPDHKIAWMYKSERTGRLSLLDIHYLVLTHTGTEYFSELHELGLFTHDEYLNAFCKAGLQVTHDKTGLCGRGMYIGVRDA